MPLTKRHIPDDLTPQQSGRFLTTAVMLSLSPWSGCTCGNLEILLNHFKLRTNNKNK